jgi:sporulation protein YlmC with PRC-barrel domain
MVELLEREVSINGIQVGRVVDVLLAPDRETVVGLEVRCNDGRHRFLPKAAASERGDTIAIDSPFALLDTDQLDYYRGRGRTLRSSRKFGSLSR